MHGVSSYGTHGHMTHHASQRVGLVAASPTLHKEQRRSLRIASKTKRLCRTIAACFALPTTSGRCFVLDGTTQAIVVKKSFPIE